MQLYIFRWFYCELGQNDFGHIFRTECSWGPGRLEEAEGFVLGPFPRLLNWQGESQFSCSIIPCPPPGTDCTVHEGIGNQEYKSTAGSPVGLQSSALQISSGSFGCRLHLMELEPACPSASLELWQLIWVSAASVCNWSIFLSEMQTLSHLCLHQLCLSWLALCIPVSFGVPFNFIYLFPKLDSHLHIQREGNRWDNIAYWHKRSFFAMHN